MVQTKVSKAALERIKHLAVGSPKRFWVAALFIVVAVIALIIVGIKINDTNNLNATGVAAAKAVMQRVSRHYLLPSGETPALATITDTAKLTSPLFKTAHNGDKVLIYQTNHTAIIYRPSIDRIVAVGPVQIDTPQGGASSK
jgi:hypothetical protein